MTERTTREWDFIHYLDGRPDPLQGADMPASNALFKVLEQLLVQFIAEFIERKGVPTEEGPVDMPSIVAAVVANLLDSMWTAQILDPGWMERFLAALGREHDALCEDIAECRLRGEMIASYLTWVVT